mgnify:CR=1 FL=1
MMNDTSLDLILQQLRKLLQEIRFGTLQVIVHDGRIVQIETTEKYRFDAGKPRIGTEKKDN